MIKKKTLTTWLEGKGKGKEEGVGNFSCIGYIFFYLTCLLSSLSLPSLISAGKSGLIGFKHDSPYVGTSQGKGLGPLIGCLTCVSLVWVDVELCLRM